MTGASLDLTSLKKAIGSLEDGLRLVGNSQWFNKQSAETQNVVIAGVIKNFEFVYEISVKMLRRCIELDAATPTEADFSDFRDLLRKGAEKGLVADVEGWFDYRKLRNITAHAYDHEKAAQVYQGTLKFIGDAKDLLARSEARNG